MSEKHYYINRKSSNKEIIYLDYDKLKGFDFSPKKACNPMATCLDIAYLLDSYRYCMLFSCSNYRK